MLHFLEVGDGGDGGNSFALICYAVKKQLEFLALCTCPRTLSHPVDSLSTQLRETVTYIYMVICLLQDMIKDTEAQSDEEIHRVKSGRVSSP